MEERVLQLARDAAVEAGLLPLELDVDLAPQGAGQLAGVAGEEVGEPRSGWSCSESIRSSCSSEARMSRRCPPSSSTATRRSMVESTASTCVGCGSWSPSSASRASS